MLPTEVRARGAVAYPAASSTSWPTALDGAGWPGILARRPYHLSHLKEESHAHLVSF